MRILLVLSLIFVGLSGCETKKKEEPKYRKFSKKNRKKTNLKTKLKNKSVSLTTIDFPYSVNGKEHFGTVSYFNPIKKKLPGVLIIPEYWGLTFDMKKKAHKLAQEKYVVMVADIYGDQKSTSNPDEAQKWLNNFTNDQPKSFETILAAYNQLKNRKDVDSTKIAIIGYSFGGAFATEMLRRGYDFKAVVNVHGSVGSERRAKPGFVKAPILWIKGANDTYIPSKMVSTFEEEMKKAKADLKVITYPNTYSGFSNPLATKIGQKFQLPIQYNPQKEAAAYRSIVKFLKRKMR